MENRGKNTILIKLLLIIIGLVLITILIEKIIAKFETVSNSSANIQTAFYLLQNDYQSIDIELDVLQPQDNEYLYTFSISNYDGNRRTQTNLEYNIIITTTTNLPLVYKLYKRNNTNDLNYVISNSETVIDEYGTYFRKFYTDTETFGFESNETNVYVLSVEFPSEYKKSEEYKNIIENINIEVDSKQIIAE